MAGIGNGRFRGKNDWTVGYIVARRQLFVIRDHDLCCTASPSQIHISLLGDPRKHDMGSGKQFRHDHLADNALEGHNDYFLEDLTVLSDYGTVAGL